VPVNDAACGLPGALSLTLRLALNVPAFLDENVTLIVQLAPMARLAPQVLLEMANWPGFAPPMDMLLIVRGAVPAFDRVNPKGALVVRRGMGPKVCKFGVKLATG
jgi:hypothetical protein